MSDLIYFDENAQNSLKKGVEKLCNAVSITMGPRGKLVLIERKNQEPHLTKDGATVAKNVNIVDRVESLGAQLLKQASENTASVAGDGSTTSAVLAKEIYFKSTQALQSGAGKPSELTAILHEKVKDVIEYLDEKSITVSSNEEIKQVATISANGDAYIGDLISNAMIEVESSGLVTVEKSQSTSTSLKLVRGIKINRGYISPYFVNNEEKSKCILEDAYILIVNNKINSLTQILPVLEKIHQHNKHFLIIANDIEQEAMQSIIANVTKGLLQIAVIKSPFYGEKRNVILRDLAKSLNTTVISSLEDEEISDLGLEDLGSCKKIEITNDSTLFVESDKVESEDEESNEVAEIEELLSNKNISREEEEFLKQRLIIIKGVVAVLSIGAYTESELLELVDRIDDALHATKAATESGFLPGGGIALAKAGIKMLNESNSSEYLESIASTIIASACMSPLKQILKNADLSVDYIIETIKKQESFTYGFDVKNEVYTDMITAGIIDPYKVTTTALSNALSVACSLMSIGCVVLEDHQNNNSDDVQLVQLSDNMY